MREVRIRLLWRAQAQFAGYLLAERLGLAPGLRLVCEEVDFACPHVEAVLAGAARFAVASPAHVIESQAPERLVMLLAIQQQSPLVYVARKGRLAGGLAGLRGARLAVWPGREDLELRWMLGRAGIADLQPDGASGCPYRSRPPYMLAMTPPDARMIPGGTHAVG